VAIDHDAITVITGATAELHLIMQVVILFLFDCVVEFELLSIQTAVTLRPCNTQYIA